MKKEVQEFFERIIGYDGKTWCVCHSKKYGEDHAWFLYDMERMIDNRVGYPSLLYLMTMITYLGACINQGTKNKKNIKDIGNHDDFYYFIENYFIDPYNKYKEFLYYQVRSKLAHLYFTLNAVTVYPNENHLKIKKEGNTSFLFISVYNFLKDIKIAIEKLYDDLNSDPSFNNLFLENRKYISSLLYDDLNERIKNLTKKDYSTEIPKNFPDSGGVTGKNGSIFDLHNK